MAQGSCYCKKISFSVMGDIRPVVFCHCAVCRKLTGHFFAASQASNDALTISGNVKWFESTPGFMRGFCDTCGSQMFWRDVREDKTSITAGAFDADVPLEGGHHICLNEKAEYYQIDEAK